MVNSLWFQWKSLKLPWRKSRLAGKVVSVSASLVGYHPVLLTFAAQAWISPEILSGSTETIQMPVVGEEC